MFPLLKKIVSIIKYKKKYKEKNRRKVLKKYFKKYKGKPLGNLRMGTSY